MAQERPQQLIYLLDQSSKTAVTVCFVFGKDTVDDYRYTRSKIGIAAQELSVDWFFSIEKLLFFQAGYYGINRTDAKYRIEQLLKKLGLDKKKDSRLRQLSGGMKRRFQIAKALVHDPDILILDEPTAGVDVYTKDFREARYHFTIVQSALLSQLSGKSEV